MVVRKAEIEIRTNEPPAGCSGDDVTYRGFHLPLRRRSTETHYFEANETQSQGPRKQSSSKMRWMLRFERDSKVRCEEIADNISFRSNGL